MGYGDISPINPQCKNRTPNLERMAHVVVQVFRIVGRRAQSLARGVRHGARSLVENLVRDFRGPLVDLLQDLLEQLRDEHA